MTTPRLPTPGGDEGTWAQILNEYLLVAHENDGTLKDAAVIAAKADTSYVDTKLGEKANNAGLATVATTGSYADLSNTPSFPDDATLVHISGDENIAGNKNFIGTVTLSTKSIVVSDDARLTDSRTPVDGSVSTGKLQDASVTTGKLSDEAVSEEKLSVANAPSNGQFLAWDGSSMRWQPQTDAPVASVNSKTGAVELSKADVGLANVDNTADTAKPISTATQSALDAKLSKAGDTMGGALTLSGNPTNANHATTKQYVDDSISTATGNTQTALDTKVLKAGDTMTGDLTLAGSPTNANHAATKKYVDDSIAASGSLVIGTTTPTPAAGKQVLWLDTSNGNITLNLVTGE